MHGYQLVVAAAVLTGATFAQAVTGFGFSLLAVPLLTLVAGPRDAVVGASLVALLLSTTAATTDRRFVDWTTTRQVLLAGVCGLPLGLAALRFLPARALTVAISVVVLGATWLIWRGAELGHSRSATLGVGVLTGALTTATGVNGPPLAAALQAMRVPPRQLRATLAAVFTAIGVLGVAGFAATGQVSATALRLLAVGVPAVAAGWLLGNRAFARLGAGPAFRRVVLCALVLASATTLVSAVGPTA